MREKEGLFSFSAEYLYFISSLTRLATPLCFNALVLEVQYLVTASFIGRIGTKEMGAYILGNMLCNITGYSLAYGATSALDTLISQAYGAQSYELVGFHAQRAIVILTMFSIPVAFVWSCSASILKIFLGIDPEIANLAGLWSKYIIIGLWPTLIFQILKKYLQGCGIVWPTLCANILSAFANIFFNYLLIRVFDWGFIGAALTVGITQWVSLLSMVVIIFIQINCNRVSPLSDDITSPRTVATSVHSETIEDGDIQLILQSKASAFLSEHHIDEEHEGLLPEIGHDTTANFDQSKQQTQRHFSLDQTWPPLSMRVFSNWILFCKLAIPGALSLFLEWGSFELMAGLAGHLSPISLATHGIYMSTCGLFYMIPLSIAEATATLAGNYLGKNSSHSAKQIIGIGMIFCALWGVISASVLLFILRPIWGGIFTSDPDVMKSVDHFMPIMFLYTIVDSTKCIALNTLRSTGRPGITAWGNILSCLVLMLPLGYLLALHWNYDLFGLWGAMCTAWFVATFIYLYCIYYTDWEEQIRLANTRNESERISTDSL